MAKANKKSSTSRKQQKQARIEDGFVILEKSGSYWFSTFFKSIQDLQKQMLNGDFNMPENYRAFGLNGTGEVRISVQMEQVPVTRPEVKEIKVTTKGSKAHG